jgi:hypothetical protein
MTVSRVSTCAAVTTISRLLNVSGQINPLSAKPYLDLQADIKGIEMTSLSPYSGKYAGYAIEKGKLSLFVKYKIENSH